MQLTARGHKPYGGYDVAEYTQTHYKKRLHEIPIAIVNQREGG